ncbi:hypothetical protein BDV96DRAFT_650766 [Lophiotrema nucula]|uniref:Uncharacterized protein n=1 Tax=Lophiotrema nucula TaxID=690887 RepID=A0A6A5YVT5_9PLEO|nr:hypothetical protein BDV96DRAFT_650766 [Lophiotrema nucula]
MASPGLSSGFKFPISRSNSATNLAAAMNVTIPGSVPRSNSATNLIINEAPVTQPPNHKLTLPELVDQFYAHLDNCSELLGRKNGSNKGYADIATAFAAAQDSLANAKAGTLDPDSDLRTFNRLFTTTHQLLDAIVEARELDQQAWAWGVFGLSAGYMAPTQRASDDFATLKHRLHHAIKILPVVEQCTRREQSLESIKVYKNKRGQIHICATLLLEMLKENNWASVRAYHAMCVADRWARNLGLTNDGP